MNKPSRLFVFILLSAVSQMLAQSSAAPTAGDAKASIIATVRSVRTANEAGDVQAWSNQVADDCIFVEPTGHLRSKAQHTPTQNSHAVVSVTNELSNIKVQQFGETAIATYVETLMAKAGGNTNRSVVRFAEVYKRKGEGWVLILSTETPIPQRQAIKVDPAIYGDYVGEYQMAPELVGTVSREGNKLFLKGTGWKQGYELVPFEKDKFFVTEFESTEIIFARDEHGKVTQQVSRTNGQDMVAKKIK
jgi:ketosteroid isomerase-like protein